MQNEMELTGRKEGKKEVEKIEWVIKRKTDT